MRKYRILDTYCKAGGAGMGYHLAGFEVVGVDIEDQPNYPFEFIQMDAIEAIKNLGPSFDAVHGSPPCQKYSRSTAMWRKRGRLYADLIDDTRQAMMMLGKPAIIENVPLAPIRKDIVLRGDAFGLKVLRKRHFEMINWFCMNPIMPKQIGSTKEGDYACIYGNAKAKARSNYKPYKNINGGTILDSWRAAMGGLDWMTNAELSEAIPPAYTQYIGMLLIDHLNRLTTKQVKTY